MHMYRQNISFKRYRSIWKKPAHQWSTLCGTECSLQISVNGLSLIHISVVGINDFEFTLHKKVSMMSFPADSSYTSTIYPWMPSMGHGSPNNVDPSHIGMGHYNGDVNFTMTGDWQIKVYLHKNGQTDSTYFDLLF